MVFSRVISYNPYKWPKKKVSLRWFHPTFTEELVNSPYLKRSTRVSTFFNEPKDQEDEPTVDAANAVPWSA